MERIEAIIKAIGATQAASIHTLHRVLEPAIDVLRVDLNDAVEQAILDATDDAKKGA